VDCTCMLKAIRHTHQKWHSYFLDWPPMSKSTWSFPGASEKWRAQQHTHTYTYKIVQLNFDKPMPVKGKKI